MVQGTKKAQTLSSLAQQTSQTQQTTTTKSTTRQDRRRTGGHQSQWGCNSQSRQPQPRTWRYQTLQEKMI